MRRIRAEKLFWYYKGQVAGIQRHRCLTKAPRVTAEAQYDDLLKRFQTQPGVTKAKVKKLQKVIEEAKRGD